MKRDSFPSDVQPSVIFEELVRMAPLSELKDVRGTISFGLDGQSWTVQIDRGAITAEQGMAAHPNATLTCTPQDFVDTVLGRLNIITTLMQGRARLEGDPALYVRLGNPFRRVAERLVRASAKAAEARE